MHNNNLKLNFLGIGAQKSGTTWLALCLREHPQIFIPPEKELDYWNKIKHCPASTPKKQMDWEQYCSYFKKAKNNQIKGEFSTHYIFDPEAPGLIKKKFPQIKIIAIIRDPIQRAYSQYWHTKKLISLKASFEQVIQQYPEFIERGLYYKQLSKYYNLFPCQNIKVVIYENFRENPQKTIQEIFSFLGVDKNFLPPSLYKKINKRKIVKNELLRNIKNRIKQNKFGLKSINFLTRLGLNKHLEKIYLKEAKCLGGIDLEIKKNLANYFKKDKENLEKLLGKKINNWSF